MIRAVFIRLEQVGLTMQFFRYIGASAVALAVDFGLYLFLVHRADIALLWAAVVSYMAGIVVHWLISSRIVFWRGAQTQGIVRVRQKALFLGSAVLGLLVTATIVEAGARLGLAPFLAKASAVVVSFLLTYLIRKSIVFPENKANK